MLFENLSNPFKKYKKKRENQVVILANGSSLKEMIKQFSNGSFHIANQDFCVVNYFVEEDIFEQIKPKYIVLSDCQFFDKSDFRFTERGYGIYQHIKEKVTWNTILFVPVKYKKAINWKKELNEHVSVVFFHSKRYDGILSGGIANFFFRRGLGNGEYGTVALNAIYAMIQIGYKEILLYGVDHNFFDHMAVNDKNELCMEVKHYYGSVLKPFYMGNVKYNTFQFLDFYASLFKGHFIMNDYAESCGVKIINMTGNSLIDAYERGYEHLV
jgi:hypothetical protein